MMRFVALLLLYLSVSYVSHSQDLAPKYSNEFLSLGVGAEAYGMGNSVVAQVDDVNAMYWNPAGLVGVQKWAEVSFMHSEYFAGIAKYDYFAVAHSIDENSTVALGFIRFGVDDIPNTTQLIDNNGIINYDNVSSFSAGDYAFLGSYARNLKVPGMSIGGTAKVIYRKVGDFAKSWGFGLDAGLKYKMNEHYSFGLLARDVTSTFNAWVFSLDGQTQNVFLQTGNEIPQNGLELTLPRFILAASTQYDIGKKGIYLGGEIDLDITTDGQRNTLVKLDPLSIDPHFGIKAGFRQLFEVRGGLSNIQQFSNLDDSKYWGVQPNLGLGVAFKGFSLDYAFTRLGASEANYYTHIFSIKLRLDQPKNGQK